jgi:hypothetical protein
MTIQYPSRQGGLSFVGLLFVAIVLAASGLVVVQVIPTLTEFKSIETAANRASAGNTVPEVRAMFDKAASIDDFQAVSGKDLIITKEGDKVVVSFAYEREIHLGGPAYLTLKYSGRSR